MTANAHQIGDVLVTKVNDLHFKVKAGTQRARTFKGESAWSDAERLANDKLGELYGFPTPGVFVL